MEEDNRYYVCIGCICSSYYSGLGLLFHLDSVRSHQMLGIIFLASNCCQLFMWLH